LIIAEWLSDDMARRKVGVGNQVASEVPFAFLPSLHNSLIACLGHHEILWEHEISLLHYTQDYHGLRRIRPINRDRSTFPNWLRLRLALQHFFAGVSVGECFHGNGQENFQKDRHPVPQK